MKALIPIILLVSLLSCSDRETPTGAEGPIILPVPSTELPRPVVNTDLTYYSLREIEYEPVDEWFFTAEKVLLDVLKAGIGIRTAWVTRYDGCWYPDGRVLITARLTAPNPGILNFDFVKDFDPEWWHCMKPETRCYHFTRDDNVTLPVPVMELNHQITPPDSVFYSVFYKIWLPYFYLPGVSAVEFYLKMLIEEGVGIRNAWMPASWRDGCDQWGVYVLVLDVVDPKPVLRQSGFVSQTDPYYNCGVPTLWNYCFDSCPGSFALPPPVVVWIPPMFANERTYFRSIPSDEYEDTIGGRAQAEDELQRLLRAGFGLRRVQVPTGASGKAFTHIVAELLEVDYRIKYFGYQNEPEGGWASLDWEVVWDYCFGDCDVPIEDFASE